MKNFPYESENFIGNRLRELRLSFGFTQEDIAKSLNVSRSTYSYYELGTTRPDPATLGRLSAYYDVPIDVFYTEELLLNVPLRDSDGRRRRTSRSGGFNPQKVGDLRPSERSLILFLRSHDTVSAEQLVLYLESRLEQKNPPDNDSQD